MSSDNVRLRREPRRGTAWRSLRIGAPVLAVSLFIGSSFSVRAVTSHNEVWVAGEGEEVQYIVASAITDGDYDWEYHHTRADAVLTSPNGRAAEEFSEDSQYPNINGQYPYARSEAVLVALQSDVGEYVFESRHTSSCPVANFGTMYRRPFIGWFAQRYTYAGFDQTFQEHVYTVTDCVASCTATYPRQRRYDNYRGAFVGCTGVRISLFGTTCVGRCGGSNVPPECY